MNEIMDELYTLLTDDSELMSKLALNKSAFSNADQESKENSIIPSLNIHADMKPIFLTVKQGPLNLVGNRMYDVSYEIRCYDSASSTGVEINNVLDRIKEVLDRKQFTLSNKRFIKFKWENRLELLPDEPFNLIYRQDRYRMFLL